MPTAAEPTDGQPLQMEVRRRVASTSHGVCAVVSRAWLFLVMVLALLSPSFAAGPEGKGPLLSAAAVHRLSPGEASASLLVKLTGTITYSDPGWGLLFLRDATAGTFVNLSSRTYPTNGQLVEIVGRTAEGAFQPVVLSDTWQPQGSGRPPEPLSINRPELSPLQIDCEWVELSGIVRRASLLDNASHLQLEVDNRGRSVRVFVLIPSGMGPDEVSQFVDAEVDALGVGGADTNRATGKVDLKMFVPGTNDLRVVHAPTANPFAEPLVTLAQVRAFSDTNIPPHRLHVQGVVTCVSSPRDIVLQQGDGALRLHAAEPLAVKVGEGVEAIGFIAAGTYSRVLEEGVVRPSLIVPQPRPATAKAGTVLWGSYDARLVQLTGRLQSRARTPTNASLALLDEGILYRVSLNSPDVPEAWERLKPGDRLEATGVCQIQGDHQATPQSFQILLRTANDVVRVSDVPTFSLAEVFIMLGVAGAGWGLVLLWGMALRKRVRQQTEIIRTRLENEMALEKQYHQLLESAAFPVMIFRRGSAEVLYLNQRAGGRLFGAAATRTNSAASQYFETAESFRALLQDLEQRGQVTERELRMKTASDQSFWALVCVNQIEFDHQPAIFLSFSDISEQKQMEERLRQTAKMEGIGQLAGGIAHEFNNILAAMMLTLDLVRSASSDAEVQTNLEDVERLSQRAADLVQQLLAFSRKSMMRPKHLDLGAVLKNFIAMLRQLVGEQIALEFSEAPDLPSIFADDAMMKQVLMNLCLNARDAMPNGGRLEITIDSLEIDERSGQAQFDALPGQYVRLSVADTGQGMSPETVKRLFEPFFTTKGVGKGTGLGLATVYGIVKQHRGWVEVDSVLGRGTTFRVCLPACVRSAEPGPEVPAAVGNPGQGTILLVEDETAVREVAARLLRRSGYEVLLAANGPEAVVLWENRRGAVDLLLTDMIMPGGLTGLDLAEKFRKQAPALKIILMSGYSTKGAVFGETGLSGLTFLAKPFSPDTLLLAIRACLDGAPAGRSACSRADLQVCQ